jgi:hypothetical protein
MSETPERKPRYRRAPSWEIHAATGVRVPGGDGPTWWTDAGAAPEPAATRTEAPAIYSADCTAREPTEAPEHDD